MGLSGKQPGLLVAVILPVLLSTIVVIVRTTRKMKRVPQYISRSAALTSETLLILSVISGWISGAFVLVSVRYGFGRHTANILAEPNGANDLVRASFWQITAYPFNVGCYCLSVAGQVLHYRTWLFYNVEGYRALSIIMNASGVLQTLFGALCIIGVFAKCTPVQANWNPNVEAKCWPEDVFMGLNYASSALTFVAYMIQAWIPIHFAIRLETGRLSRRKWTALIVLASWNIIAGVLALVKLGFLHLYVEMEDPTYSRAILVEIGLAENGASGIVPSAPEMWSLAQQLTNRAGTAFRGQSSSGVMSSGNKITRDSERPPSRSSDAELTANEGEFGKGTIMKTTAWETSSETPAQDSWLGLNENETIVLELQPNNIGHTRSRISRG